MKLKTLLLALNSVVALFIILSPLNAMEIEKRGLSNKVTINVNTSSVHKDKDKINAYCKKVDNAIMQGDFKAVFKWSKKAAKLGCETSQCNVAWCYKHGEGTKQSYKKAFKWYEIAAKNGSATAQHELGDFYYNGYGILEKSYSEAVKWFSKSAEQGYAAAQFSLGICYEKGHGVAKSNLEAIKWYRKAADQGYDKAAKALAAINNNSSKSDVNASGGKNKVQSSGTFDDGVKAYDKGDYKTAFSIFKKYAEQGDASAQCNLGLCYEKGNGVTQSYSEAVKWYRKAAEQGFDMAQCYLGFCYEEGYGITQSYAEAVKWYRKSAEQGYAGAQCNLGYCYANGKGVTQSYSEAVKWYRKSAEQGLDIAQYNLGRCYEYGYGVTKLYTEAVKWYRKAADLGYDKAAKALAAINNNSSKSAVNASGGKNKVQSSGTFDDGVKAYEMGDYKTAFSIFKKYAEQGLAQAQYNLALCYAKGEGVQKSSDEAINWLLKAAAQGFKPAQELLKKLYPTVQNVETLKDAYKALKEGDYKTAIRIFTKLAEQNNAEAQRMLGWCFENGIGVEKSDFKAIEWYTKAAERGDKQAQDALEFYGF